MLTNPLTQQTLNSNPEGCNQYSGKDCSGHTSEDVRKKANHLLKHLQSSQLEGSEVLAYWREEAKNNGELVKAAMKDLEGSLGTGSGRKLRLLRSALFGGLTDKDFEPERFN